MHVAEYFEKLKKIWDEIQSLEGIPECVCGALTHCSCRLLKKLMDMHANDRLMQFLMDLSDCFESVRSQILSTDPLPIVNRAFYLVQQVEKQRVVTGTSLGDQEASALVVHKEFNQYGDKIEASSSYAGDKRDNRKYKNDKGDRKCNFCHQKGHYVDQCFKLYGYPKWFTYQKKKENSTRMAANVDSAGILGTPFDESVGPSIADTHFNTALVSAICTEVMRAMKGKAVAKEYGMSSVNFADTFNASSEYPFVLDKQLYVWVVDSGASDHMVCDSSLLLDQRTITRPVLIKLPDYSTKKVTTVGSILLANNIWLHEVLLVPEFKHNLLFVGRMLDFGLQATFEKTECQVKRISSGEIVTRGPRHGNLFFLSSPRTPHIREELACISFQ